MRPVLTSNVMHIVLVLVLALRAGNLSALDDFDGVVLVVIGVPFALNARADIQRQLDLEWGRGGTGAWGSACIEARVVQNACRSFITRMHMNAAIAHMRIPVGHACNESHTCTSDVCFKRPCRRCVACTHACSISTHVERHGKGAVSSIVRIQRHIHVHAISGVDQALVAVVRIALRLWPRHVCNGDRWPYSARSALFVGRTIRSKIYAT